MLSFDRFTRALIVVAVVMAAAVTDVSAQTAEALYGAALAREEVLRRDLDTLPVGATSAPLLDRLNALVAQYGDVVRRYPRSGYSDNALWQAALLHADAWETFQRDTFREAALQTLTFIENEYPTSSLVQRIPQVQRRLAVPIPAPRPAPLAATAPQAPAPTPVAVEPPARPGGPAQLTAIRREILPGTLRIILELDGERPFYQERLDGPSRVFVDLTNTLATEALKGSDMQYDDDVVRRVRLGLHENQKTRVVLDLEGAARHSVYPVYDPFRLVIDLERDGSVEAGFVAPPPAPVIEDVPAPMAATANADGNYSISRQLGLGVSRIVIDPGHGGRDPGSTGRGLVEADLVLDVALRVEQLLLQNPGVEVQLTRRSDTFLTLQERTALANRVDADLFLSIHANASRSSAARGIETYFLNFARDPEAEALAARENAGSGQTMNSLPDIVQAIATNNKIDESRDFASMLHGSIVNRLITSDTHTEDRGVKQAPFVVLIGATMPSVLAEISFLTNPDEAALLHTDGYRQQIAEALVEGVMSYQHSLTTAPEVAAQR